MLKRLFLFILLVLVPTALMAQREKLPPEDYAWVTKNFPSAKKSNTGIRYIEIENGRGETINRGDLVSVLYVGRFLSGETFDQKIDPKDPLTFRVGRTKVVRGWDYILRIMRLGDKWLVIIPPELAYGTKGRPPMVPSNKTLVFTMQVLDVKRSE